MKHTFEFDKVFSSELYLPFYEDRNPEQDDLDKRVQSRKDTNYIEETLDPSTDDTVLDLACGHGRIANLLAERGYDVHGLDASRDLIRVGISQTTDGTSPKYQIGDMRALPYRCNTFDLVYSVFNSFGYFNDRENTNVIREISRVLKPGGKLLLEILDRDYILQKQKETRVTETGDVLKADRLRFDPETGRRLVTRTVVRNGETIEFEYFLRVYSFTEIRSIVERIGFEIESVHGNMRGEEYSLENKYICLVAENN